MAYVTSGSTRLQSCEVHKTCEILFDGWRELIRHAAALAVLLWTSDGSEIPDNGASGTEYPAFVTDGKERRVYASLNPHAGNGTLAWVRGSFPHDTEGSGSLPEPLDKTRFFPSPALLRAMLEPLGLRIRFRAEKRGSEVPVLHLSMNDNALYLTGYAKDTTVKTCLSFLEGAPLMEGFECVLENDTAEYISPKVWHKRCRLFARQKARSVVGVSRRTAEHPTLDERFLVTGLVDAQLTFRPPVGARVRFVKAENSRMFSRSTEIMTTAEDGKTVTADHLTGDYYVAWQSDHNPGCMLREDQHHPEKVTEARR